MNNLKIKDVAATILDNINYEVNVDDATMKYSGAHIKHLENYIKLYGKAFADTPQKIVRYKAVDDMEYDNEDDCVIENMLCATCNKIKDSHFSKHERQQWLADIIELIWQMCRSTYDSDGDELCRKVYSAIIEQNLSGGSIFEDIKNLTCVWKYRILYRSLEEVLDY